MTVTFSGKTTESNALQYAKAARPTDVILFGKVMDVIFLWKNAVSPIAVTVYCLPSYVMDSGITISPLYWWEGLATTSVRPVFTLILYMIPSISTLMALTIREMKKIIVSR
jgi:hypothetical protein